MYRRITHTIVEEHFDFLPTDSPGLFKKLPYHNRLKSVRRNLRRQKLDSNDYVYQSTDTPLRNTVDLRQWAGPVDDQFELGSCTANATVNAYELLVNQLRPKDSAELSRLFVYYNSRKESNTIFEDSGAFVRDALKAVMANGISTEELWPYNIDKFTVEPSEAAYQDAKQRKISQYQRIKGVDNMLDALNNNRPVVFGTTIFDSFLDLNSTNYVVSVPVNANQLQNLDGHAMCMIGYNLDQQMFLAKNSFGTEWGDRGFCWITFDYIKRYGYDMWVFDLPELPLKNNQSSDYIEEA